MRPDYLFRLALIGGIFLSTIAAMGQPANVPTGGANTNNEFPTPPEQHNPWDAFGLDLPTNLISSTKILFDLGFADPRGCEYREFEYVAGSVWGGTNRVKAHGWVIPSGSDATERFAIGWDGLVYRATQIGPLADLQRDAGVLLDQQAEMLQLAGTNHFAYWEGMSDIFPRAYYLSETNATIAKILPLMRLGETNLAQRFWKNRQALRAMNELPPDHADPFRELAFAWCWSLFDRAVCAHMYGDHAQSVEDCRELMQARPELEQVMAQRGIPGPLHIKPGTGSVKTNQYYFDFLDPVPILLADEERRMPEAARDPIPEESAGRSNRIAALILNLDQVQARQWGQPGGVSLNSDPMVTALIAEGDAAVPALLQCMESDRRLTRSVSFFRDFDTHRNLIPVSAAAQAALDEILNVRFDTTLEYRAYWEKYQAMEPAERWYQTLKDDQAGRKQWMQAAENFLQRTDGKVTYHWKCTPLPDATNKFRYIAFDFHAKKDPSVSELMSQRALEIAPTNFTSTEDCWKFDDAANLGLMMTEWDPQCAKSALPKIIDHCPVYYERDPSWTTRDTAISFARLAIALGQLGDTSGVDRYATWLAKQKIKDLLDAMPEDLSPLGYFPDLPSVRIASTNVFQMGAYDWYNDWNDLLKTRLVLNASFQQIILQGLSNQSKGGTFMLKTNGDCEIDTLYTSGGGRFQPDPLAPAVGQMVTFRVCDSIASRLTRIEGLPSVKVYWPEAERDTAIAKIIPMIKNHGNELRLTPIPWGTEDY